MKKLILLLMFALSMVGFGFASYALMMGAIDYLYSIIICCVSSVMLVYVLRSLGVIK